jgi:hypothetical protein
MEHKMPNFRLRRTLRNIVLTLLATIPVYSVFVTPVIKNRVELDTAKKVHQTYEVAAVKDIDGDGDLDVVVMSKGLDYNALFSEEEKKLPLEDMYFINGGGFYLRSSQDEINQSIKEREERFYQETFDKVMRLADRNGNGVLEFGEQADAWRRMGFKDLYVESRGESQFQKPKLGQLGNAVASYEREKQHDK